MYRDLLQDAVKDKIQVVVVAAILQCRELILLLEKGHGEEREGLYEIPSAILKKEETFQQALHRAVTLETNLTFSKLLGYVGHFDFESSAQMKHRQFVFAVEVEEPEPVQLNKHMAYTWLSPQEAAGYPITDGLRSILNNFMRSNFYPQGRL